MEQSILKDKIILIVDDYFINTELLSIFVSDAGAIPLTASNGIECVEIVKKQHVDMILMDNNMPVMNGIEATEAVRSLPQGKDVAIVGFSGNDEKECADDCIRAGMDMVVAKLSLNEEKLIEVASRFFCTSNGPVQAITAEKTSFDKQKSGLSDRETDRVVLDYNKALREFDNDNDLLIKLIIDFNRIIHTQHTAMLQALDRSDYECMWKEAHGIKGGAANLCAMPLSEAAKMVEAACKQRADKETVARAFDTFTGAVDAFDLFVKSRLADVSQCV